MAKLNYLKILIISTVHLFLYNLCIADYINFSKVPNTVYLDKNAQVSVQFIDDDDSGTYTEIWNFNIILNFGDTLFTLANQDSINSLDSCNWNPKIGIPPIPLENNKNYTGYITVQTTDSDNEHHSQSYGIWINPNGHGIIYSDGIYISEFQEIIIEQNEFSLASIYDDADFSGSQATHWNWDVNLISSSAKVHHIASIDSLYGINQSTWNAIISTIPSNIEWLKNPDGLIMGFIVVSAISSDGINYYGSVNIGYKPITTGLGKNDKIVHCQCELMQNFPNPFNSQTNITFKINMYDNVELTIYNINGQKIKTLVDDNLIPGLYSVTWHGDDLSGNFVASGVYIYRLKSMHSMKTKKIFLVK